MLEAGDCGEQSQQTAAAPWCVGAAACCSSKESATHRNNQDRWPSENLLLALCSTGEGQWRERSWGLDVGPCPDGVWAPALTLHVQQFLRGILPEDREAPPECCECGRRESRCALERGGWGRRVLVSWLEAWLGSDTWPCTTVAESLPIGPSVPIWEMAITSAYPLGCCHEDKSLVEENPGGTHRACAGGRL